MSPATQTAVPASNEPGLWLEGVARTDQEFFKNLSRFSFEPVAKVPPWTDDPQKWSEAPEKEQEKAYRDEWVEASTTQRERVEEIDNRVEALFETARELQFEDGLETEFSKELVSLVRKYGTASIEMLTHLIVHEKVSPEVSSEALRWLGRMADPVTYRARLWLLERSLNCSSAMVRDGAALGLASVDDLHAIPYLQQAIHREPCGELRKDMEQVLAQLENAR